jgi:hypothetical protein
MYEPRPRLLQATASLLVRSPSVMSPRADGTHGEDWPLGRAPARDDEQPVGEDRRRRRDLRAAAEPPELRPRPRIVPADEVRRVGHQLGPGGRRHHGRRAPRRQLVALGLPHDSPVAASSASRNESACVSTWRMTFVPDDRRAGRPPFERRDVVGAHVHAAEIHLPQPAAVHVVCVHALRAEPGDDDPAVGRRGRAGVGGLDVALLAGLPFEGDALPEDLARALVERVEHPLVGRAIVRGVAVAVEAGLEGRVRAADGRRDEHAVAPHDGARVREARDRRAPEDVGARRPVPRVRQLLPVGHAGGLRAAERRPAAPARGGRGQGRRGRRTDARDPAFGNWRRVALGPPPAVVQDHAPGGTVVGDGLERQLGAHAPDAIAALGRALGRPAGRPEHHLVTLHRPRPHDRRPSLPLQRERAVGRERGGEAPVLKRRRGNHRLLSGRKCHRARYGEEHPARPPAQVIPHGADASTGSGWRHSCWSQLP